MKAKLGDPLPADTGYPYVGMSNSGIMVLFHSKGKGITLNSNSNYEQGEYRTDWLMRGVLAGNKRDHFNKSMDRMIKKPKITKGEWEVSQNKDGDTFVVKNNRHICQCYWNGEENAKAISAVPGMIDALIGLIFMHRKHYGLDGAWDQQLKDAEKALKKAGVVFETEQKIENAEEIAKIRQERIDELIEERAALIKKNEKLQELIEDWKALINNSKAC